MSQMIQRKQTKSLPSRDRFILSVLLLALTLWPQPKVAQAQWTSSGNDIYSTNTGNVGIGTSGPMRKLEIVGDVGGLSFEAGTGSPNSGIIRFGDNTGWKLHFGRSRETVNGTLNSGTAGVLMTIQDNGNVGIGTTTPLEKLHVHGNIALPAGNYLRGGSYDRIWFPGVALGSTPYNSNYGPTLTYNVKLVNGEWKSIAGGKGTAITGAEGWFTVANTNNFTAGDQDVIWTDRLVVHPNGNVGIGTGAVTPRGKLDISASGSDRVVIGQPNVGDVNQNSPKLSFYGGGDNISGPSIQKINTAAYGQGRLSFFQRNAPNYTDEYEAMVLDKDGNLGIGITNPSTKLHIYREGSGAVRPSNTPLMVEGTGNLGISVNQDAGSVAGLYFNNPSGAYDGGIEYTTPGRALTLRTAGTTRMTIDSSGNVTVTGNIAAKYQDVAEWVPSPIAMPAGTVIILDIDHSNQVLPSVQAYDTRVAGVVSDMPGILLGEAGEGKVKVATTGRVKVKVYATKNPIYVGDLLVTSDKEGIAMKSEPMEINGRPFHQPGTILGKALEPLKEGEGEILVLLSLQ